MHPAREEVAALIERSGKNIKEAKAIVRRLRMVQSRIDRLLPRKKSPARLKKPKPR